MINTIVGWGSKLGRLIVAPIARGKSVAGNDSANSVEEMEKPNHFLIETYNSGRSHRNIRKSLWFWLGPLNAIIPGHQKQRGSTGSQQQLLPSHNHHFVLESSNLLDETMSSSQQAPTSVQGELEEKNWTFETQVSLVWACVAITAFLTRRYHWLLDIFMVFLVFRLVSVVWRWLSFAAHDSELQARWRSFRKAQQQASEEITKTTTGGNKRRREEAMMLLTGGLKGFFATSKLKHELEKVKAHRAQENRRNAAE